MSVGSKEWEAVITKATLIWCNGSLYCLHVSQSSFVSTQQILTGYKSMSTQRFPGREIGQALKGARLTRTGVSRTIMVCHVSFLSIFLWGFGSFKRLFFRWQWKGGAGSLADNSGIREERTISSSRSKTPGKKFSLVWQRSCEPYPSILEGWGSKHGILSWIACLVPLWSWQGYLTTLHLSFLICKMGIIIHF